MTPVADRVDAPPRRRGALALAQLVAHGERMPARRGRRPRCATSRRARAGTRRCDAMHARHFTAASEVPPPVTIAWAEKDRLLLPRQAERARAALPLRAAHRAGRLRARARRGTTRELVARRDPHVGLRLTGTVGGQVLASLGSSLESFFDAVGSFFDSLASIQLGAAAARPAARSPST